MITNINKYDKVVYILVMMVKLVSLNLSMVIFIQ